MLTTKPKRKVGFSHTTQVASFIIETIVDGIHFDSEEIVEKGVDLNGKVTST